MTQTSHTLNGLSPTYCLLCQQQISSFAVDKLNCSAIRDLRKLPQNAEFLCDFLFCYVSDKYMPEGMSEMSRFSKVSSILGRDAFATMRYVTLLNVSDHVHIFNMRLNLAKRFILWILFLLQCIQCKLIHSMFIRPPYYIFQ